MPRFGSDDDRLLQATIERWKRFASDGIDTIAGWRQAPGVYFGRHAGPDRDREQALYRFLHRTTALIGEASRSSLDPRPLQAICDAVSTWHREGHADRLPGSATLDALLDSALLVVLAIEDGVGRRMVREKPVDATSAPEMVPHPDAPLKLGDTHRVKADVWTGGEWVKVRLTQQRFMVLERLLKAYVERTGGLSLDELNGVCGGARDVVRLMRRDPILSRIVTPPGKRGDGYGLMMPRKPH